jgi:hypothetical protein
MSEANSLAEDLGLDTRFRPHKKHNTMNAAGDDASKDVVCHIYEDGVLTTEVPLPLFERRFKCLQGRWNQLTVTKADKKKSKVNSGKALKAFPSSSDAGPPGLGGASEGKDYRPAKMMSQEAQDNLQREIKRVTLETLSLADRMWQQLDRLEKHPKPLNPFVIH